MHIHTFARRFPIASLTYLPEEKSWMEAPKPFNEFKRLVELSELDLDYTNLHNHLEEFTSLAAQIAGTETALVNLIDSYTQWSVAGSEKGLQQIPREESICQYTILEDEPLEIKDLNKDKRSSGANLYANQRYYFGVPLKTSKGLNIGSLCVLDTKVREFSPRDKKIFHLIGNQIIRRLEELKKINELENSINELSISRRRISHDIRNPISGIIGLAHIVEDEIKKHHFDQAMEFIGLLKEGGNNLLELVEDITKQRDISKQHQRVQNVFSCNEFCQKLKTLYGPRARSEGITLTIEPPKNHLDTFFSRSHLLQIAGILISNSITFTPPGGSVCVEIMVDTPQDHAKDNILHLKVADTSLKMTREKAEGILQYTGKPEQDKDINGEHGYGSGLVLGRRLVQKAGGSMDVTSGNEIGMTILVQLPV